MSSSVTSDILPNHEHRPSVHFAFCSFQYNLLLRLTTHPGYTRATLAPLSQRRRSECEDTVLLRSCCGSSSGNCELASRQHNGSGGRSSEAARVPELGGGLLPLLSAPGRPQCARPPTLAQVSYPLPCISDSRHQLCTAVLASHIKLATCGLAPLQITLPFPVFIPLHSIYGCRWDSLLTLLTPPPPPCQPLHLPPFPLNTLFALSSSSPTTETPYLCACDIAQSKCPSSSLLCTSPVDLLCTETGEGLGRDFYKGWGGGGWLGCFFSPLLCVCHGDLLCTCPLQV